jgi:hypothetical protein
MRALLVALVLVACGGSPAPLNIAGEYTGGVYLADEVTPLPCNNGTTAEGTFDLRYEDGITHNGLPVVAGHYDLCGGYAKDDLFLFVNDTAFDGFMLEGGMGFSAGVATPDTLKANAKGFGFTTARLVLKRRGARTGKMPRDNPPPGRIWPRELTLLPGPDA